MDARNGRILWSTADPSNALAFGPVTLANGVLFAGSTHGKGPIYAMNAITGKVLWSYDTGGTVYGGISWMLQQSLCSSPQHFLSAHHHTITATTDSDVNTKQVAQNWPNHGGDLYNRRYANKEKKISPKIMSKLHLKWKFYAGASDGLLVWKKNLQKLTGFVLNVNSTVSRSTPTIAGDLLIVGLFGPAVVIAAKRSNRNLMWSTGLDDHARGNSLKFYVGTSSIEEDLSVELCCTFRGSLAKLDAKTGRILWQTFMLPDDFGKTGEYTGAAI
ncbi:hypothetical protein Q3G72_026015 [Acer saccharum]|nr:hypothetical protein Q3G72_026015 [Acer saccharum]